VRFPEAGGPRLPEYLETRSRGPCREALREPPAKARAHPPLNVVGVVRLTFAPSPLPGAWVHVSEPMYCVRTWGIWAALSNDSVFSIPRKPAAGQAKASTSDTRMGCNGPAILQQKWRRTTEKRFTTGTQGSQRKTRQHANWSRVIFSPGKFPSTVTATDSVLKNSLAKALMSSAVTASILSINSSRS
jgi:hypothetical protein